MNDVNLICSMDIMALKMASSITLWWSMGHYCKKSELVLHILGVVNAVFLVMLCKINRVGLPKYI